MKKHSIVKEKERLRIVVFLLTFFTYSISFAQEYTNEDSIFLCYCIGVDGIGGQDHCITIHFENNSIFCKRICYNTFNHVPQSMDICHDIDVNVLTHKQYKTYLKQKILNSYTRSNYLVLDEGIKISNYQLNELIKIINEIKTYKLDNDNLDEIIVSTKRNHYRIKDKSGELVIIDWFGGYNKSLSIEKVLGLKNYLRCPRVEEDLKQINKSRK